MSWRIAPTLFVVFIASSTGLARSAADRDTPAQSHATEAGRVVKAQPAVRSQAGLVRYGSGNWKTLTETGRYGVLIVGAANARFARARRGRVLLYGCGGVIPKSDWSELCGVRWDEAVANDWLLKDTNGRYIASGNRYPNLYLADIGKKAYQQRFIHAMTAAMRRYRGVDGVFIDNVVGNQISASAAYPDSASYRAAMLAFISVVGRALKTAGWYVGVNAGMNDGDARAFAGEPNDGSQYIWWYKQIAPYVNAISTEHWQESGSPATPVRTSGEAWYQQWERWERLPSVVASLGKDFYAVTRGALTDTAKAAYLRASFLLALTPGRGTFFYTDDSAGKGDPWTRVATPHIGRPEGPMRRIGVGFARTFTAGVAAVNPNPSQAQTFDFQRKYLMPDGTKRRSIALRPASAVVLRRASSR